MERQNASVKARGFGLSGASLLYLSIYYIVVMLLCLLFLFPLEHFFPSLRGPEWILIVPYMLPVVMLIVHLLFSFCTVTLTEEAIVLSWLCIPLRRISPSDLRLFCAVGNGREDVLCLTSRTITEMAALEEQCLLRNFFTKYDVPNYKKRSHWQDTLCAKYLNRLRRSPRGLFRDKKVLFLKMDPVVQRQIRDLYPQLPYKNYTGIVEYKTDLFSDHAAVPCFGASFAPCFAAFRDGEILLQTKKEIRRKFSPDSIQTIVRVDIFKSYDRMYPHHIPVLFLSVYSPEEMADMAKKPEADPILTAYRYAESQVLRWSVKREDCCNLPCTAETAAHLHLLCPQARWISIADSWLFNQP